MSLPTFRVLDVDTLTPEGFAATLAASEGLDAARVYAPLTGAASTRTLPVVAAVRVCTYLARRDLDAAKGAIAGDDRKKVREEYVKFSNAAAFERLRAAAEATPWERDAVLAAVSAAVTLTLGREAPVNGDLPAWPQGPSPHVPGATVPPPLELRVEVLAALFDGRIAELDPSSDDFDAVAALAVTAPLSAPTAGLRPPMCPAVAAVLTAATWGRLTPNGVALNEAAQLPSAHIAALGSLAAQLAADERTRTHPGLAAPHFEAVKFQVAVAALLCIADPGAAHDGRAAACFANTQLCAVQTRHLSSVAALIAGAGADEALAEVADAATCGGALRRPLELTKLPDAVAAKGPVVCAAIGPTPTNRPYSQNSPEAAWAKNMCGAAVHWSAEAFDAASGAHPETCAAMLSAAVTVIGADRTQLPRWVAHASMRTRGLAEWLRRDPATATELASAAGHLGLEGWRTVWGLVDGFHGTPAELVAIAQEAS